MRSPKPSEIWGASDSQCRQVEDDFYRLMASGAFLPNSPTLMNAGRRLGMLSACFVLPLEDSIEEIMATARQIALVQRAGGGTGIDLSRLRPQGSIVRSSGGTTDGPLSFLKMLSGVTEAIQQGAFRRGANMGIMRVDHPDILSFIDVKSDLTQLSNYNLSVAMTDAFMEALKDSPDAGSRRRQPAHRPAWRAEQARRYGPVCQRVRCGRRRQPPARSATSGIGSSSGRGSRVIPAGLHRRGQPAQPDAAARPIRATNPCGEQPLLPYEACNLGSINLAAFCVRRRRRQQL